MSSPAFDVSPLRDARGEVRLRAVQALASAPLPAVERLEGLFGALTDSDWRVVAAAHEGLAAHRNPEAVEAVLRQLEQALDVALPRGSCAPSPRPCCPCCGARWSRAAFSSCLP